MVCAIFVSNISIILLCTESDSGASQGHVESEAWPVKYQCSRLNPGELFFFFLQYNIPLFIELDSIYVTMKLRLLSGYIYEVKWNRGKLLFNVSKIEISALWT
jgi:hypothetical protein